jgi:hypothetical protein
VTQRLWQPDAHKLFYVFEFKPFLSGRTRYAMRFFDSLILRKTLVVTIRKLLVLGPLNLFVVKCLDTQFPQSCFFAWGVASKAIPWIGACCACGSH